MRRKHPRYTEFLPAGFWSDVPLSEPFKLLGCVVVCESCSDQLGPVWTPADAALAIHAHQLRAHEPKGPHRG